MPLTREERYMLDRVIRYAGKDRDKDRISSPNITTRETIYLANGIVKLLENECSPEEVNWILEGKGLNWYKYPRR